MEPFVTMAMFVGGFVLASSERLWTLVRRRWRAVLVAASGTMTLQYAIWIIGTDADWTEGTWRDAAYQLFQSTNTWLWVLGLLGAASVFRVRPAEPLLRYANEAAYPWYVPHQTVIVMLAYAIVRWNAPLASKYILVLTGSIAVTFALYEVLVRRTNPTRFLFGLKPKTRRAPAR